MSRLLALALVIAAGNAFAERADRHQPTQIEADRMSADEARRISIFEGNVVLTKGTLRVQADRIVVRLDADGFHHATATGRPVRFRQRGDPRGDREGVWTDGEARRIEIDERNDRIELFERARVTRDRDEIHGEYIFLDQRAQSFAASAAKGAPATAAQARVRAVLQPKAPAADSPSRPGAQ